MKMSVRRWPEILRPLWGLFRRFVGQHSQQISEWSSIFLETLSGPEEGCVLGEGLGSWFRYETIIKTLLDSNFNEESNPAFYQIAINQQQAYKDKVEQENKPDNFPSLLERLDFRFETLKNTFLSNIELLVLPCLSCLSPQPSVYFTVCLPIYLSAFLSICLVACPSVLPVSACGNITNITSIEKSLSERFSQIQVKLYFT